MTTGSNLKKIIHQNQKTETEEIKIYVEAKNFLYRNDSKATTTATRTITKDSKFPGRINFSF